MSGKHAKKRDKQILSQKPAAKPFAMPGKPWHVALACLVIAAAALVAYHNSFSGALFFDNEQIIAINPMLSADDNLGKIFTSSYWAPAPINLYRPLTIYTYYINYKVWGWAVRPQGYHIFNLVLHILNACLVFLVASRISRRFLVGALSALLFVTHPVTTEAVTNVVGRADLLAMFFVLIAFLLHITASVSTSSRRYFFYVAAALSFALGLLSKENAVAGIAVFTAFDIMLLWPRMRNTAGSSGLWKWLLRRLYSSYLFYVVIIAGWLVTRYFVLYGQDSVTSLEANPLDYAPFFQREATAIVMLGLYFLRFVWPVTLSADYSYNQIPLVASPLNAAFLASLSVVIAAGAAVVLLWKRSRPAAFFMLFFFISVAPVSNIFLIIGTIGAERLLYMPLLAWCGGLGMLLVWLIGRLKAKQVALTVAVAVCLVGLYSYRTILRNQDWRTEKQFWAATWKTSPNSAPIIGHYASTLINEDPQRALDLLKDALKIDENFVGTCNYYADATIALGDNMAVGDPRKAREIYLDGLSKTRHCLQNDGPFFTRVKQRLAPQAKDFSDLPIDGVFQLSVKQTHLLEQVAETYGKEKDAGMYLKYYRTALENAKKSTFLRPNSPMPHMALANECQHIARAIQPGDAERQTMFNMAAVAYMRAFLFSNGDAKIYDMYRQCYKEMYPGKEVHDAEHKRLAVRSQLMIELAAGLRQGAENRIKVAVSRFGVLLSDLEPLLSESFTKEDERIWMGQ
jgi:tetratricopeptide (TPR) repeat protein